MTRLLLALLALSAGCYMKAARTNNPLHSAEGVRVRLLGQDCEDHSGGDGDPISRSLDVKLELMNPTKEVLQFAPAAVRLTVEQWAAGAVRDGDAVQIAPGETRSVEMRFVHHSMCGGQDFVLAFDHAFTLGTRPVTMAALHFTPY